MHKATNKKNKIPSDFVGLMVQNHS